ncbi:hypothetical protein AK812_SmicGene4042 [Symbiodinium microadriaticum]|uniref:Uncharacterized protein n=1 Tax=Symbiodinium microadriaticum TaxID=2951 RepID=A0A1Q9EX99_SYMMI|nr:hypothetical protein AK812_SmicGene4042 [Symbiodinium microadriaticum]
MMVAVDDADDRRAGDAEAGGDDQDTVGAGDDAAENYGGPGASHPSKGIVQGGIRFLSSTLFPRPAAEPLKASSTYVFDPRGIPMAMSLALMSSSLISSKARVISGDDITPCSCCPCCCCCCRCCA